MIEILMTCVDFVSGLILACWGLLVLVFGWAWDVLYHLHTDTPRLEGLLIGVTLAWFLLRRDKHPLLRVVSAPLKLVVDILDLAWDQVVQVVQDVWGTAWGWVTKAWNWTVSTLKKGYNWVLSGLGWLKEKLSRSKD